MQKSSFDKARTILKRAREKRAFVPMPGGAPAPMPMDPAMAGGAMPPPPGAAPMPPMDPAMMGAYAAPPMDPAMAGGMPPEMAMGGMPPEAMGGGMPMEPTVAELPISEFQALIADTVMQVLGGGMDEGAAAAEEEAAAQDMAAQQEADNVPPSHEGPTNQEVLERLDAIEGILSQLIGGGEGMPPEAMAGGMPPPGAMPPEMMGAPQGLEVAAGARPKHGLADMLVERALKASGGGK